MFSAESIMLHKDDLLLPPPPPPLLYLNVIGINLSADTEHCLFVRRLNRSPTVFKVIQVLNIVEGVNVSVCVWSKNWGKSWFWATLVAPSRCSSGGIRLFSVSPKTNSVSFETR